MLPQPRRTPIARRQDPGLPRWVIVSLAGLGALSLILGAFAVGLLMGRPAAAPVASHTPVLVETPEAAPAFNPTDAPSEPTGGLSAVPEGAEAMPSPPEGPRPLPKPVEVAQARDGVAVAAYFSQMDLISAAAKSGQNPEAVAQKILEQAASGDLRGFDELLTTQRALESRMARIDPPVSCREHHRRSLGLIGRGIALLERARSALGSQDMGSLASLGAEGQAIEREAKEVDALAADIRRFAGL